MGVCMSCCCGFVGFVVNSGVPSRRQSLLGRSVLSCVPYWTKEVFDWSEPSMQHLLSTFSILMYHGFVCFHPVFQVPDIVLVGKVIIHCGIKVLELGAVEALGL
jgi:hypothetical protein